MIESRKQKYNNIYHEVQEHHFPKDFVGPKVSQQTSTIYTLFSKINILLPHQWQQEALQTAHFPQNNEDLNLFCEVSGLNRKDIKKSRVGLIKELYKKDQIKLKPTGRGPLELFNIQGEDGTVLTACSHSGCIGNLPTSDLIQNDSLHNKKLNNQVTNVAGGGQISSKSYILLLPHEQTDMHKYLECQSANVGRNQMSLK